MKTYSIGREQGCDIVINDNTDVISRRHAILNVTSTGKMTIIDQSTNGTYINGIRISSNVPVPVTRKDVVSFAKVSKLDWSRIPASDMIIKYAIMGVVAVALIILGVYAYMSFQKSNQTIQTNKPVISAPVPNNVAVDTLKKANKETEEEMRERIARSLKDSIDRADKAIKDSIANAEKARQDSIDKAKKAANAKSKSNAAKKAADDKKKQQRDAKLRQDSIKASQFNM